MNKNIFIGLVFLLAGLLFPGAQVIAADELQVSGVIESGLRILTLVPGGVNSLVIYRGDYIKPKIAGVEDFEVLIPELKVAKKFPVKEGEPDYIKMKKPGTFAFSAGAVSGYIKVIEYAAPSYTALPTDEAAQVLKNTNPLILDVRTEMEYQQGHIQGSTLIPVQVLQQNLQQLEPYKSQDIFIYCASGNRSTVASRLLIENGFKKIYNLRYGFADWVRKGYPVVQ